MLFRSAVLIAHLVFALFVVLGGVLVLRWPKLAWIHLPAVAWAAFAEFSASICPLTPLEIYLRLSAGEAGYTGGFIDHYVTSALYPDGLTRGTQIALGAAVVAVNAALYVVALMRSRASPGR